MRHTKAHRNNRRSHDALKKPALTKDETGNASLRHRLSPVTGSYRGRKVIDFTAKVTKRAAKAKATGR
jgi:large subunit ribosomal protein L32